MLKALQSDSTARAPLSSYLRSSSGWPRAWIKHRMGLDSGAPVIPRGEERGRGVEFDAVSRQWFGAGAASTRYRGLRGRPEARPCPRPRAGRRGPIPCPLNEADPRPLAGPLRSGCTFRCSFRVRQRQRSSGTHRHSCIELPKRLLGQPGEVPAPFAGRGEKRGLQVSDLLRHCRGAGIGSRRACGAESVPAALSRSTKVDTMSPVSRERAECRP